MHWLSEWDQERNTGCTREIEDTNSITRIIKCCINSRHRKYEIREIAPRIIIPKQNQWAQLADV